MEKYYVIYFDEVGTELTLFENKFLNNSQYTKSSDNKYVFTDIIYEEKVLRPNVDFLGETYLYDGYKLNSENSCYCNDYDKDGFMYDRKNQRVVYGKVPVYVSLVGDTFIDVVTGQAISRNLVKMSIAIDSAEGLHEMANDLIKISEYTSVYSIILSDWISMFSSEYINMCSVQEIYDELCFKKYCEEYGNLDLDFCSFEQLEESVNNRTVLQIGEYQKIRKIVRNIRKSPNS